MELWTGSERNGWSESANGGGSRGRSENGSGDVSGGRWRWDCRGVWGELSAMVERKLPTSTVGVPEDFEPPPGRCLNVVAPGGFTNERGVNNGAGRPRRRVVGAVWGSEYVGRGGQLLITVPGAKHPAKRGKDGGEVSKDTSRLEWGSICCTVASPASEEVF